MENTHQSRNKKFILSVIALVVIGIAVFGVTYAFFNYTKTGGANTIKTGRIYFTSNYTAVNLTNAFPITSTQAQTDTTNAKTISITVTGDTDYSEGLEYLVTATDVHMTIGTAPNTRVVPLALEITTETIGEAPNQTSLGTSDADYYTNRTGYAASHYNRYKIEYDGSLDEGDRILVGYIAPNTTQGVAQGVNGLINIKAYFDSNSIAISDTYNGTETATDDYGTTSDWVRGREVFTTSEWNSIQASGNELSFKVKVESNEGIWVRELTAVDIISKISSLETTPYGKVYSGASVNNYVKFNCTDPSDSTTCEDWRILGVYTDAVNGDKLKIVRQTPIASQNYNNSTDDGNVWGGSRLEQYLNQDTDGGYYYSLNTDAKAMIADGSWDVGACTNNIAAAAAYTCATTTNTYSSVTYTTPLANKKVGLIATYEYLYAAENDGTCWTTAGNSFSTTCAAKDWLFSTLTSSGSSHAWTLSPTSNYTTDVLDVIRYGGYVGHNGVNYTYGASPVVYLKSGVTITGGNGQSGNNAYTLSYNES